MLADVRYPQFGLLGEFFLRGIITCEGLLFGLSSLSRRDALPSSARFAASSTGKYKSKMIGFRLAYRGDSAAAPATAI